MGVENVNARDRGTSCRKGSPTGIGHPQPFAAHDISVLFVTSDQGVNRSIGRHVRFFVFSGRHFLRRVRRFDVILGSGVFLGMCVLLSPLNGAQPIYNLHFRLPGGLDMRGEAHASALSAATRSPSPIALKLAENSLGYAS